METESANHQSEGCKSIPMMGRKADAEPSEKVAGPDIFTSGTTGMGQENEELKWMRKRTAALLKLEEQKAGTEGNGMPAGQEIVHHAPKLVERKTGLRGQAIDAVPRVNRPPWIRTEKDLLAYDSDVPYTAVEKANRNLVCSLIERQDRVSEKFLLMVNDLQYRLDDLELAVEELAAKPAIREKEAPE